MRGLVFVIGLGLGAAVAAEEVTWQRLTGAEITAALTGRMLDYGAQWQDFRASGRTLYFSGRDTWGYWAVRSDQYCSMWPPSDLWVCYGLQTDGERVRFVGGGGALTVGAYKN